MADLKQLLAWKEATEESIASQTMSITVEGQTTVFCSMADRMKFLARLDRQIAECTGQAKKRPQAAKINLGGGV